MDGRWFLAETGDVELGFSWDLLVRDGDTLRPVATYYDEAFAKQAVAAHEWQDSLGASMMRLAQDGITIDANTGRVWTPPKQSGPNLKITKARKKA